jgi:diadenosine tetraphosphate (Ap4A) HIT family hydrolase
MTLPQPFGKTKHMEFELNPRLAAGGFEIVSRRGCRVLLKNEANFPWFILIPEVREGIEDLHQLDVDTFHEVTLLIREMSEFVSGYFKPEKLNVACIGNMVRQMHIHVVGRFTEDPAWPGVVWAFDGKLKYDEARADQIVAAAKEYFERLEVSESD